MPVWALKCRFGRLSAGSGGLSAGFTKKKKREKKQREYIFNISRKGSVSCAFDDANTRLFRSGVLVVVTQDLQGRSRSAGLH